MRRRIARKDRPARHARSDPMNIFFPTTLLAVFTIAAPATPVLHIPVAPFRQTIAGPATLESSSSRLVRAPEFPGERTLIWLVDEGANVKKGDVIARFDPTPVQLGLDRTLLRFREARDQIETLETDWSIRLDSERIRATQLDATFDEAVRQVAASRFLPEIPKSIASIKRDIAAAQSEGAEGKISLLEESSERQRESAEEWMQGLEQERNSSSRDLDETVIRAGESGFVTHLPVTLAGQAPRKVQSGDALERRQPFLKIQPSRASQLQIAVTARDLPLIKRGQPVEFSLPSDPDRWLHAEISDTPGFSLPSPPGMAPSFAVMASVPAQPGAEHLRAAMTASVRIHIRRIGKTLALPIDWVFHNGANRVVCKAPDGRWAARDLPADAIRSGDYFLLPPAFAQADTSGGLLIQPPPQGSAPAQTSGDISSRP